MMKKNDFRESILHQWQKALLLGQNVSKSKKARIIIKFLIDLARAVAIKLIATYLVHILFGL